MLLANIRLYFFPNSFDRELNFFHLEYDFSESRPFTKIFLIFFFLEWISQFGQISESIQIIFLIVTLDKKEITEKQFKADKQKLTSEWKSKTNEIKKSKENLKKTEINSAESDDVELDLSSMKMIDSAGIGMLLLAKDRADKAGKSLCLRGVTGHVAKVVELSKVDQIIKVVW